MSQNGRCAKNRRVPRLRITREKAGRPLTRGTACRPAMRSIGNAIRSPHVKGRLRWALLSPNNHVLVSSPGSYARRRDAIMGFCRVLEAICRVVDEIHALRATKKRRTTKRRKGTPNAAQET